MTADRAPDWPPPRTRAAASALESTGAPVARARASDGRAIAQFKAIFSAAAAAARWPARPLGPLRPTSATRPLASNRPSDQSFHARAPCMNHSANNAFLQLARVGSRGRRLAGAETAIAIHRFHLPRCAGRAHAVAGAARNCARVRAPTHRTRAPDPPNGSAFEYRARACGAR